MYTKAVKRPKFFSKQNFSFILKLLLSKSVSSFFVLVVTECQFKSVVYQV